MLSGVDLWLATYCALYGGLYYPGRVECRFMQPAPVSPYMAAQRLTVSRYIIPRDEANGVVRLGVPAIAVGVP